MKLKIDLDIGPEQADNAHGKAVKDQIVLHETVSAQARNSLADIRAVSRFLDNTDNPKLGIHAICDDDGFIAWARTHWNDIFYHTASSGAAGNGHTNTRAIGIELISRVMLDHTTQAARLKAWLMMDKEVNACAKLIAAICNSHPSIPLADSAGRSPGVTTHWEVTHNFLVPGGHTDCWPVHQGGYFPKGKILTLAKRYKALGYRLP